MSNFQLSGDSESTDTWWVISSEEFLAALRAVAAGGDPDLIYMEWYANAEHQ